MKLICAFLFVLLLSTIAGAADAVQSQRLPNGLDLAPAGDTYDVGNMPLSAILAPDGKLLLSMSGFREQGIQVVDPNSRTVTQTLLQTGAFLGITFSSDGKSLYASGANEDLIHVYTWKNGIAELRSKINLAGATSEKKSARCPAGIALSRDGNYLYVAENCSDTLALIDLRSGSVVDRKPAGHYPYAVVLAPNGRLYVSAWGGNTVSLFKTGSGKIMQSKALTVVRHPSALLLNSAGSRLFVASGSADRIGIIDVRSFRLIRTIEDPPPNVKEGSTPNAFALSPDGSKLYVAEALNNAVAVFQLSDVSSGKSRGIHQDRLIGRIPVGWYPTALLQTKGRLFVINGKGRGTRANPGASQGLAYKLTPTEYTLGQLNGTITELPSTFDQEELRVYTERVSELNHWSSPVVNDVYPPFKHVMYIIKENRTYDQVFGDLPQGDGDSSLTFFPRMISPNHHSLVERFGLFDRFFVNAEVSLQGHPWSTSAYVTDFTEKTVQSVYSDRREGESDEDEVTDPANGYLWDLARRSNASLRIYGEKAMLSEDKKTYRSERKGASEYTSPTYPSYDLKIQDQVRVDAWLSEFRQFEKAAKMPALQIFHLPNDHTAGARAGWATPAAYMADNDLALGRIVEALSNSVFWKDTVVFVVEDDSQSGPDHVDSHRSVLLVISPYNKPGVLHRFVNTTDVIATMERILGMDSLSQFDRYGRPLHEVFSAQPDLTPYKAITPEQSLEEKNPESANAKQSLLLNLEKEDLSDDDLFNRILWKAMKGDHVPFPDQKHLSLLQIRQEE